MKKKLSYVNINKHNLNSLYKYYYIKKFIKNITIYNNQFISFFFYGTMLTITPIIRIECNKFFNKKNEAVIVNFSVMPYNNVKSMIRFSNLTKTKNRVKGEIFYQIEIQFSNKFIIQNSSLIRFEQEAILFKIIISWFNQYINPNIIKKTEHQFFPSIIYIPTNDKIQSYIRYSSIYNWITKFESNDNNPISFNMRNIFIYNQTQVILVIIYNQKKLEKKG